VSIALSPAHNAARLDATRAFADAGEGNSTITFFIDPQPASPQDPATATPLCTVTLAKPCGTITNGVLTLAQQDLAGDLVLASGTPTWARWYAGDGQVVCDGDVTDDTGTGVFRLAGDNGALLYAGAALQLGTCAFS